jgi:hypothetical protein
LIVVVEDERRSAAGSDTPVGSGIAAADKKVVDWRNIGVWASVGCILVVVGLLVVAQMR